MRTGSSMSQKQQKSETRPIHTSRLHSQSSSKRERTTDSSRGSVKKSSSSSKAIGSKSSHSVLLTNQTRQDNRSSQCLSSKLVIGEKPASDEWIVSQLEKWTPQIHHMINLYPVYGMDREDVEQELRMVTMRCLANYKPDSSASFHSYLYRAMLLRILVLRKKESRQYKLAEKVMYNGIVASDFRDETDLLNDRVYTSREQAVMKAAMKGMTAKDIRRVLNLSVKEFNKIKKSIADKMLRTDPDLSEHLAQESRR